MIIKEKIYMASVNLKIDISNLRLMKSSYWLLKRGWMSLDKIKRNFTPYYVKCNCIELWVPVKLSPTSILAFRVVEVEAYVIVYHNIIFSLPMLFFKAMLPCVWSEFELFYIRWWWRAKDLPLLPVCLILFYICKVARNARLSIVSADCQL